MDDRLQDKNVSISLVKGYSGYYEIDGMIIDESPLYYVVQCVDDNERLVFKSAIRYITIQKEDNENGAEEH